MQVAKTSSKIGDVEDKRAVANWLDQVDFDIKSLMTALQGRISFGSLSDGIAGENMSGEAQVISDTGSADTEFSVTHTLGVSPSGFIVVNIDKGGVVYDSGTTWTSTTAYFKCSTANTNVTLFLLK